MFTIILTVFAMQNVNPAAVQAQTVSLEQVAQVTFTDTTDKKAMAACTRVAKAFSAANKVAYCAVSVDGATTTTTTN